MLIETMFSRDINRTINGVIKVMQDDDENLQQELEEYVITRELQRHFNDFYDHYGHSLHRGTDQMGVWISGFFGSGKSHFLKILSYLLSNQEVNGRKAIDYFEDKFSYDPLQFEAMLRASSIPTETILFNIDSKSTSKEKDAILRVFTKVFYEHCGYYGDDLKVARFERMLDRQGDLDAFKTMYHQAHDEDWALGREAFYLREEPIVQALVQAAGISEQSARNWFNSAETAEMSIDRLAGEIKEYVQGKSPDFRLIFLVDEVGQYIGDDSGLMLNLQTMVEDLGTKCEGRVWIIVTSQEDIDSVTKVKGNDFSKITGRFNTRLSLSSSSVDEVIKRRILEKTGDAKERLSLLYHEKSSVLKNLITFSQGTVADLKGFTSAEDFAATYPFVPYQYLLMQAVLTQIRKHGSSGRSLSSGARSMLSCFQEAAQSLGKRDEDALVPFCSFYDTIHTFLDGSIRGVIERATRAADAGDVIQHRDIDLLKLLFLIRYVDTLPPNLENLSTLMVDSISADKIKLRRSLQESLDRLVSQNYVSRNGESYFFLTDDEQDINRDIRNTLVDQNDVIKSLGNTIFRDLYPSTRVDYGNRYAIPYDQYIDESAVGNTTSDIRLRFISLLSDLSQGDADAVLMMRSQNNEAIVLLSNEFPYFQELEDSLKITRYVRTRNVAQLPESHRQIIQAKQSQARDHERRASDMLKEAILRGTFYITGARADIRGSTIKEKLDSAMRRLVEDVFVKLNYLDTFVENDADIQRILNDGQRQARMGAVNRPNSQALDELAEYMKIQHDRHIPVTMKDLLKRYQAAPYGWREIDISALVATLVADLKLQVISSGNVIAPRDTRMVGYLRKRNEVEMTRVKLNEAASEDLIQQAREAVREVFGLHDVEREEGPLCDLVEHRLQDAQGRNQVIYDQYSSDITYPGKALVQDARSLFSGILAKRADNVVFLRAFLEKKDALLAWNTGFEKVRFFFDHQRVIFDQAANLLARVKRERSYFSEEEQALQAMREMEAILAYDEPYDSIRLLDDLRQVINLAYGRINQEKHKRVEQALVSARGDIHTLAGSRPDLRDRVREADERLARFAEEAMKSASAMELMALITEIEDYKDRICAAIEQLMADDGSREVPPSSRLRAVRRVELFPQRVLQNEAEIADYLERVKGKMRERLEGHDGLQLL